MLAYRIAFSIAVAACALAAWLLWRDLSPPPREVAPSGRASGALTFRPERPAADAGATHAVTRAAQDPEEAVSSVERTAAAGSARLGGVVVLRSGEAAAHAVVIAVRLRPGAAPDELFFPGHETHNPPERLKGEADEHGRFSIGGAGAGDRYALYADMPGRLPPAGLRALAVATAPAGDVTLVVREVRVTISVTIAPELEPRRRDDRMLYRLTLEHMGASKSSTGLLPLRHVAYVEPGAELLVAVAGPGLQPHSRKVRVPPDAVDFRVEMPLEPAVAVARLEVTVTEESGRPLADAPPPLIRRLGGLGDEFAVGGGRSRREYRDGEIAVTHELSPRGEGRFAITLVEPGEFALEVRPPDGSELATRTIPIDTRREGARIERVVALLPGGTFEVRDSAPLPEVYDAWGVGQRGRFRLQIVDGTEVRTFEPRLAPGPYRLVFPDGVTQTVQIVAGAVVTAR